jgi:transcriptional regulator with XRE-family HTH domain
MSTLGERIHKRRTQLNWTLAMLSKEADVSKGFLSDLENNKKKSVGGDKLRDISRALGVTADYLLSGDQSVHGAPADLNIPQSLATFAQNQGLSFSHTAMLLQLRRQILAFRSDTKSEDLEEFDWKPFYESVKMHLK